MQPGEGGADVEAAGGVVLRAGGDGVEVLVVHRARYDDWSLPKGKLDAGETHADAARREVEEETGWECALGGELTEVRYVDHRGRPKRVRWWTMRPVRFGGFTPNDEIDALRWLPVHEAATLLTYDTDRGVLAEAARRAPPLRGARP